MLLRKYKRCDLGGKSNLSTMPFAMAGNFAGDMFDSLTPTNQYGVKSDFDAGLGAGLKGAGTGAELGTAILPGLGTGIGAGIGFIGGAISGVTGNRSAQLLADRQRLAQEAASRNRDATRIQSYDTQGSGNGDIYRALGGYTPIARNYSIGGGLNKLSSNRYEVEGRTHAEGGVKFPQTGVELEDNETVAGDYVFSDKLGFADLHKPIARMIGKMEKKPQNRITEQTLKHLRGREESLKQEQEDIRQLIGGQPLGNFAFGGDTGPGDREKQIAAAYQSYVTANDGTKPFAPVEERDPIFYDENKYNSYYTSKAANMLAPEERQVYRNHMSQGRQTDAYNMITLKGGTLPYDVYKSFLPAKTTTPTTGLPGMGRQLGVRPDKTRTGFNNNGRLGFRTN